MSYCLGCAFRKFSQCPFRCSYSYRIKYGITSLVSDARLTRAFLQARAQLAPTAHTTTTTTRQRSASPVRVAIAAAAAHALQRVGRVALAHGTMTQTRRQRVRPAQRARMAAMAAHVPHLAARLATKLVACWWVTARGIVSLSHSVSHTRLRIPRCAPGLQLLWGMRRLEVRGLASV